jgi:hypothetical protein
MLTKDVLSVPKFGQKGMSIMRYKNIYKSIISSVLMTSVVFVVLPAVADGDSLEIETMAAVETEKVSENVNALLPDEEGLQAEDAVATVTAEGDFLLPTYLLPGDSATIERTTTVEQVYETPKVIREKEVVVPVVVADALKTAPVTELTDKKIVREDEELEALLRQTMPAPVLKLGEGHKKEVATSKSAPRKLLIPLAPIPVGQDEEVFVSPGKRVVMPSGYADKMAESIQADEKIPFLMPHEIRITFYPKASAFSGQTLKWVRAFALAALKDPRLVVEVRASCAEADLQDARLALVKAALKNAGLSTHQIVVNYTNRPVDTMLLRAVPRQEAVENVVMQKDQKMPKNMSKVQKW